jgi:glucokinase
MKYVAAVDVGGTSIKAALVSQDLEVVSTTSKSTPQSDLFGVETAKTIASIVTEFSKVHSVSAVGFAVPGALSESEGISRWTGNLGWKDLPIREIVAGEVQLPVAFGHDVRVGALAELRSGAAREFQQSIFIPIGTGIAAALVIDGEIRNSDGYAGEIGHLNVGHDLPCVCGLSGCLETISSASAISREYHRRTGYSVSAKKILKRIRSDDHAWQVWEQALAYLAIALEDLITILAPEAIIFGGGLSQAGAALIEPLKAIVFDRLTFQRRPEFLIAHYGANAGTIGSAIIALDLLEGAAS